MSRTQANWARQHDWYHSEQKSDLGIIIWVREQGQTQVLKFTNYNKLRIWAGY